MSFWLSLRKSTQVMMATPDSSEVIRGYYRVFEAVQTAVFTVGSPDGASTPLACANSSIATVTRHSEATSAQRCILTVALISLPHASESDHTVCCRVA